MGTHPDCLLQPPIHHPVITAGLGCSLVGGGSATLRSLPAMDFWGDIVNLKTTTAAQAPCVVCVFWSVLGIDMCFFHSSVVFNSLVLESITVPVMEELEPK